MGGHDAGSLASATVVDHLASINPGATLPAMIEAVRAALGRSNAELLARAAPGRTIGATVVAIVADSRNFCCLWAGDCRAFQIRGDAITQLTRDHSLVQQLVDAGELGPDEAASHPQAHVVTRAVGAGPELRLSSVMGDLEAGDALLLASDGLTRLIPLDELLAGVRRGDIWLSADDFIATCLERGAPDNVSLVLVEPEAASGRLAVDVGGAEMGGT
jgi:serine/threonine protein phosphatase PrpC